MSVIRHCGGSLGRPEVWVTMSPIVISRALNDGTLVPSGSSLAMGSLSATSPRAMKSARRGGRGLLLCRLSAAGMTDYPRAEAAGVRKAPRHEIAVAGNAVALPRAMGR